jgi:CRP/FNR family transcriptional regulator, cyclic AMP receptor protein
MSVTLDALQKVPFLSHVDGKALNSLAQTMSERDVSAGKEIVTQGKGGVAFFLILEGTATVIVDGEERRKLGPGDHFGEIALIDGGQRLATVTATTDLVCHGLTYWEFRPLVQESGALAWKLLQTMARMLRAAEEAPAEAPG